MCAAEDALKKVQFRMKDIVDLTDTAHPVRLH